MGLINDLALRQEDYRALVREIKGTPDRSFSEAVATVFDEDQLVAISTVLFELKDRDPDQAHEAVIEDVLWAGEFIDHLDTLGWEVRRKPDAD